MMSTAQFGRELANDRIDRLIEEARSSALSAPRTAPGSPQLAGALRRLADRIDPSGRPRPTTYAERALLTYGSPGPRE